jgi:Domain of unknown function (DUF4406)
MTGYPEHNYPAFHEAAKQLRAAGYEVLSPAEIESNTENTWETWMRLSIALLIKCHEIVLLPDWHKSTGARLEQNLAAQLRMKSTLYSEFLKGK